MLNHRYLVGGVLGEGGFGITYIGLDTLLQMRVAIKEFYPSGMVNRNNTVSNDVQSISADAAVELFSKSRENFLHEARTLAKFANEPGIVSVKDFFEENHTVYIVMEYLDGITLKNYLKQVGTISSYNTICLLMPVFRSLKKIHEKNLIHRDISPDNIMLVDEEVKLLDFGAAREFADEKSLSVILKHGYAPMEQYRRHGKQGAWTDIYAICATVYKCITGTIPPDATDRVFDDNLKMPSELGFDASPEFDAFLRHGLAVRAENRIQSIDQLFAELAQVPDFDIDFSDDTPKTQMPVYTEKPQSTSPSRPGARLSEYIPRGTYEEDESTVAPAQQPAQQTADAPAVNSAAPGKAEAARDRRLSAYIPASAEPAEPLFKQPEQAPAEAVKPEEPAKKSKKPLILASAAAAVLLAAGAGIFLFLHKDSPDRPANSTADSSAVSSADSGSETEPSSVTDADNSSKSDPSSSQTDASQTDSGSETSENPHMHIIYPELGGNFSVDNGLLKMNSAVFSMTKPSLQLLFGSGTLYVTNDYAGWKDGQTVMLVPIDLGVYGEDYFDSVDLYFVDDTLYMIQFEQGSEFNEDVRKQAVSQFGEPFFEDGQDIRWALKDQNCLFEIYMQQTDDGPIFSQRYVSKVMAYEENMVEEGFFDN
ncbi:MAG: protein kinase [Oscillospiraceae bacterium]|nr:protein kinase [Oscillospiraceae bacterium]